MHPVAFQFVAVDQGNLLLTLIGFGLIVLKAWALVDCVTQHAAAFPAHDKLTKQIWLAILAVTLLASLHFAVLGLLSLAGDVAAIVYLVDVRPAVSGSASPW